MVIVDLVCRSHLCALAEALVAVVVVCYMYVEDFSATVDGCMMQSEMHRNHVYFPETCCSTLLEIDSISVQCTFTLRETFPFIPDSTSARNS